MCGPVLQAEAASGLQLWPRKMVVMFSRTDGGQ